MAKHVIIFTWGDGKRLGYSKFEGEIDWIMDMPEVPRDVAKIMNLKASDESIDKMIKEMEANGGTIRRSEIEGENE